MGLIRVIDFEATGLGSDAQIVEVGFVDFDSQTRQISTGQSWLCRVDHMPPDTRAVHHIRVEDAAPYPPYDRRCLYEQARRDGVVGWAAHSADFEARYLCGDIPLVCTYKAALRVFPQAPAHGVFALLYWLEDAGLVEFSRRRAYPPHRAEPDAYATAVLLSAIYAAGHEGRDLIHWTQHPAMLPRCPIGDWRGHPWSECDRGFLEWILRKIYDREDVRYCAELELQRRDETDE